MKFLRVGLGGVMNNPDTPLGGRGGGPNFYLDSFVNERDRSKIKYFRKNILSINKIILYSLFGVYDVL